MTITNIERQKSVVGDALDTLEGDTTISRDDYRSALEEIRDDIAFRLGALREEERLKDEREEEEEEESE